MLPVWEGNALIRYLAIASYLLVFIPGWFIPVPFFMLLFGGLFEAEPPMITFIVLADIALIGLLHSCFIKPTRWTWAKEIMIYVLLQLPLLNIFVDFTYELIDYYPFIFPFGFFMVLFPLSIYFEERRRRQKANEGAMLEEQETV